MREDFSAGGIIFRKHPTKGVQVLLIIDSHGNWAFPKGKIEANETSLEAAHREIAEEVSLTNLRLIKSLGIITYWYLDKWEKKGDKVKKTLEHFLFEVDSEQIPSPQETEIQAVQWFKPEEINDKITYKTLNNTIKEALKEIDART